jgi:hypothetical protein
MKDPARLLVAGAGPAGLVLALQAQQHVMLAGFPDDAGRAVWWQRD